MRKITYQLGAFMLTAAVMVGCKSKKESFDFVTPSGGQQLVMGQQVDVKMRFPDTTIDSVVYTVDGAVVSRKQDTTSFVLNTDAYGLGAKNLVAKYYKSGEEVMAFSTITIVPTAPKQYRYEVVNTYPHDVSAYTQGLAYENGQLYESTGSPSHLELVTSLRRVALQTGEVLQKKEITGKSANGIAYFGEGLTIVDNKIVMLTWENNEGFVFDKRTFQKEHTFNYENSKYGWGLCYDGDRLIKSDGSNMLIFLDPQTFKETGTMGVYDNQGPVSNLNELEYIDGKVYANVYGKDVVMIINPQTGAVEGQINFVGLFEYTKSTDQEMNGIAYDAQGKRLFVTGKTWDKLFEVKIIER